jgi:uncharacterized protein (UPF0548 family)
MFTMHEPPAAVVRRFLAEQRALPFSYPDTGASLRTPPAGYVVDHNRTRLGSGIDDYARAVTAIRRWKMFELGWVHLLWPNAPIEVGSVVAVRARALGLWSLNPCRIIAVIEDEAPKRFGFAYGTLPGHVEKGEERFTVEMEQDGSVWYDLLAFSRPRHWAARLGYPFTRRLQKRFARDSMAAMRRAVGAARE